jgi:uncharacterized membrane protein YphA (DoxX/SURF4 family)
MNRVIHWLGKFYENAKANKWYGYFAVFCRIVLAAGFIPSGIVKLNGERFTALSSNHPLGHYFEALHLTGYYYTFLGMVQLLTAALLLIPRTALLGALMYFPIILNICILAYATRFEGTRITTLMVLANLYLLCWDYDRLKHILPFKTSRGNEKKLAKNNKFPFVFFSSVVAAVVLVIVINNFMYNIRPGNSIEECSNSCKGSDNPQACINFCDCIHNQGKPLQQCLDAYDRERNSNLRHSIEK